MPYGTSDLLLPVMAVAVNVACAAALAQSPTYNLGRTPSAEEIRAMGISVGVSGKDLPPGSGTAKQGAEIYARKCAACHGAALEGSQGGPRLAGGKGTIATPAPVRTIGSFWPYATSIFDTINRAMPAGQPGTLQPDEVYALTAFLLYRNDIIQETDVIDAQSLPKVPMPNRNGFVPAKLEEINRLRCRVGTCP
jgi:cytochrome c